MNVSFPGVGWNVGIKLLRPETDQETSHTINHAQPMRGEVARDLFIFSSAQTFLNFLLDFIYLYYLFINKIVSPITLPSLLKLFMMNETIECNPVN